MAKSLTFCILVAGLIDSALFFSFDSFKKSIHIAENLREQNLRNKGRLFTVNLQHSVEESAENLPNIVQDAVSSLSKHRSRRDTSGPSGNDDPVSTLVSVVFFFNYC